MDVSNNHFTHPETIFAYFLSPVTSKHSGSTRYVRFCQHNLKVVSAHVILLAASKLMGWVSPSFSREET